MPSLNPLNGILGARRAAHLLRRTSFRYTQTAIAQLATLPAEEAVNLLLTQTPLQKEQPAYDNPDTPAVEHIEWLLPTNQALPDGQNTLRRYVIGWWLHESLNDPGITQKMTLFFHQYLAVSHLAFGNQHLYDYLRLLRWGALGNFKKLAAKMVADNTMLLYLGNHYNVKNNPNENFAREFFELFTVGKGPQSGPGDYTNYTEEDIIEAARVFTGFRARSYRDLLDPETGIPRGRTSLADHDRGLKSFSHRFQHTSIQGANSEEDMWREINDLVDMTFHQFATAKTFCTRLYRWFVNTRVSKEVENDIILPLAETFYNSNYEVKPVLAQLLKSEHFFAEDAPGTNIGNFIKSPLELALHTLAFFEVPTSDPNTDPGRLYEKEMSYGVYDGMLADSGFPLFDPPEVAGYPAYYQAPIFHHDWFNSRTVIPRYKLPAKLLSGKASYGPDPNAPLYLKLDIVAWVRNNPFLTDPSDPHALVAGILQFLFPEPIDSDRFEYFYQTVFLDNLPPADWTYEWQQFMASNNDSEVRIPLERLVFALMDAPEFQTF